MYNYMSYNIKRKLGRTHSCTAYSCTA